MARTQSTKIELGAEWAESASDGFRNQVFLLLLATAKALRRFWRLGAELWLRANTFWDLAHDQASPIHW